MAGGIPLAVECNPVGCSAAFDLVRGLNICGQATKGYMGDVLALEGEEGRGSLRKARRS
jgi:hypothetical protein